METKNFITLKIEKNEQEFLFQMENGAPLGATYDVLMQFADKILSLINEHAEKLKPIEDQPSDEQDED